MRYLILAVFSAIALSACGRTNRWTEEVELSDGTVLTIDRAVLYRPPEGGLEKSGAYRPAREERMTFIDPATGRKLEWYKPHRTATWLDRIDGQLWIVGELSTVCYTGYAEQPVWAVYRLRGKQWIPVAAADAPGVSVPNLLLDTKTYRVTRQLSHVSLAEKRRLNDLSRVAPHFRSIDLHLVPKC